jgi:hypothetical protein
MDQEWVVQQLAAAKAINNGNGFNAIPPAPHMDFTVFASVSPGTVPPTGSTWTTHGTGPTRRVQHRFR